MKVTFLDPRHRWGRGVAHPGAVPAAGGLGIRFLLGGIPVFGWLVLALLAGLAMAWIYFLWRGTEQA